MCENCKSKLKADLCRYGGDYKKIPKFQKWFRKYQDSNNNLLKILYKVLFVLNRKKNFVEMSANSKIGKGLYIGHPFAITINPESIIGENCNIHKGVTIGQENRGKKKGTPSIGNEVWIGINSTIVGNVRIGNDVLISANSFVNFDVPDHSIVIGNPGKIIPKENATKDYINNKYNDTCK